MEEEGCVWALRNLSRVCIVCPHRATISPIVLSTTFVVSKCDGVTGAVTIVPLALNRLLPVFRRTETVQQFHASCVAFVPDRSEIDGRDIPSEIQLPGII